jgi:hypothetical protein
MIDRERILATDHETRLWAEARLRRMAAEATSGRKTLGTSAITRIRISLGQWLIGTGRRLDTGADPCGPAEARAG